MFCALILSVMFLGCYNTDGTPDDRDPQVEAFHTGSNGQSIVMCGDSRFHMGVAWDALDPYTVYNVSYSGTSSWGGLKRLEIIDQINPDVVVLGYGVNDQLLMPLDSFKATMSYLVMYHMARGRRVVVVLITHPWGELSEWAKAANEWMAETYPENALEIVVVHDDSYDGCHFVPEAYVKIAEQIKHFLE